MVVGWEISVGKAGRYGLDGSETESQWGEIFCTRPDRLCGTTCLLYNAHRVFPGVKRPKHGVHHPPPSSADVKGRVHLYRYSPSGPLWPVLGWNLTHHGQYILQKNVWMPSFPRGLKLLRYFFANSCVENTKNGLKCMCSLC